MRKYQSVLMFDVNTVTSWNLKQATLAKIRHKVIIVFTLLLFIFLNSNLIFYEQTLYRLTDTRGARPTSRDTTLSLISGLMADSLSRRLPTLPLWTALQALGRDGIVNRFKQCFLVVEELYSKIKKFNCIRLLVSKPTYELNSRRARRISNQCLDPFFCFSIRLYDVYTLDMCSDDTCILFCPVVCQTII